MVHIDFSRALSFISHDLLTNKKLNYDNDHIILSKNRESVSGGLGVKIGDYTVSEFMKRVLDSIQLPY